MHNFSLPMSAFGSWLEGGRELPVKAQMHECKKISQALKATMPIHHSFSQVQQATKPIGHSSINCAGNTTSVIVTNSSRKNIFDRKGNGESEQEMYQFPVFDVNRSLVLYNECMYPSVNKNFIIRIMGKTELKTQNL